MVVDSNRGMSLMVEGAGVRCLYGELVCARLDGEVGRFLLISEFKVQCGAEVVYEWCQ